jgi:DNA repair protein RadC
LIKNFSIHIDGALCYIERHLFLFSVPCAMEIRLTDKDKKQITSPDDIYGIMQRILLRENKIDREKEHFWIIGMDMADYILYIELVSLGSVKSTIVEPMNVYRFAVMKNAVRVIAVHNHPGGNLTPSPHDKDTTDRLIQVGRILGIVMEDHLIISTTTYLSFVAIGLMTELEASLKYVPTYKIVEKVREEEKAIADEAFQIAQEALEAEKIALKAAKAAKQMVKAERDQKNALIKFLMEKNTATEEIANILKIPPEKVEKATKKKT